MKHECSPSKQILDLLPAMLRPADNDVDTFAIRTRLDRLDRQELLLVLARWLYNHRDVMDQVAFDMVESDIRVQLDNDEVTLSEDVKQPRTLINDVVALQQHLDSVVDQDNSDFIRKMLEELNKVGWTMPDAWHVLERLAPTDGRISGTEWLDEHRAAWVAKELENNTCAATPTGSPRSRM